MKTENTQANTSMTTTESKDKMSTTTKCLIAAGVTATVVAIGFGIRHFFGDSAAEAVVGTVEVVKDVPAETVVEVVENVAKAANDVVETVVETVADSTDKAA